MGFKISKQVKGVANVATGGMYGVADGAVHGDIKGAAESGLTAGMVGTNSADAGFNKGKIAGAIDKGVGDAGKAIQGLATTGKNKSTFKDPNAIPTVNAPTMDPRQTKQTMVVPTQGPQHTSIERTATPGAAKNTFDTSAQYGAPGANAQNALMAQLAGQANGTAPSVAEGQLRQGQEANLAATMAQLASSRGQANPLAQRQAMQNSAAINATTNQQAAMARLQEQQGAQGMLGQVSGQAVNQGLTQRGQDIGVAGQNADLRQGATLAGYQGNLQTNLAQGGITAGEKSQLFGAQQHAGEVNVNSGNTYNDLISKYAGYGLDASKANAANVHSFNQDQLGVETGRSNVAAGNATRDAQIKMAMIKGAAGIAGGIASGLTGGAAGAAGAAGGGAELADSFDVPDDGVGNGGYSNGVAQQQTMNTAAHGAYVGGKANVPGDSPLNDTVHVRVSPGEVILPRSVVNAPDQMAAIKKFMHEVNLKAFNAHRTGAAVHQNDRDELAKRIAMLKKGA